MSVSEYPVIMDAAKLFTEEIHSCPLCGSAEISAYESVLHHKVRVTYRICRGCGLVYQSPRIPETKMPEFYESQYRLLYLGQAAPREQELEVQRRRAQNLVDFLDTNKWIPTHHLDIGCGSGALLHATQSHFNCKVAGIELDEAHRAYATENGLKVYDSLENWQLSETGLADLVSMSHVLEHLAYPVEYLIRIRETVLSREGRLLIEVPNLYFHSALEIAHTYAFSLTTLRNVLHKAGFELIRYKLHSVPRPRLCPLYIAVIARPDQDAMQHSFRPDRYSRQRRKLGRRLVSIEAAIRRRSRRALMKLHEQMRG